MKPYLEHIAASKEGSWTLFDRRLPAIPFEWHYNTEYELTLTLNSRGQRFIGDSMARYDDGDLVLIGPRIPHTWCSSSDAGRGSVHQALVLWFSEDFVQSLILSHVELRPVQRLLESSFRAIEFSPTVRAKARSIICAMLEQSAEDRLPALLQLLLLLSRDAGSQPLTSSAVKIPSDIAEERIGRVLSYLHLHYQDQNAVQELSRIAALSRSSLHRLFKLHTGTTITDYISRLRIGNACALLINTQRSISFIADDVGYRSLANFNRQFKAFKSTTPRQFRSAFNAMHA
ncbi:AraC-like DNA-binding protein [Granulicella aggregans]|uniref:AraC-like DNA-binding protein n=1 Tax=Granulicella aggregans TaxID=474949 RepID=A0A7W7ZD50_9BACT|nr:AraC family transcriptional regulator [Granulicella aggregans]MBB5057729.1 AraC-like DNA-binding protein [Granulicella aggregans]